MEDDTINYVEGHKPAKEKIQFSIGPYDVFDTIGKGGMGEVFLAYDRRCGRRIALKKIREDLLEHKKMHYRFKREAHITCQLTHPSIIPIYSIEGEYYTMPYVEGETLKQILQEARKKEKKGEPSEATIPALLRIYLSVCQAVAYTHSNDVLHRDLKPENIIVGPFGEVMILDWGLAKVITSEEETLAEEETITLPPELTRVGKVVGTVAYMAPERAKGEAATFQTDVYSLGVILFQILTLRHPFRRGTLKEFREKMDKEVLPNPVETNPHRDISGTLSHIAMKCLDPNVDERYQSVAELITDLENYIEGRAEWFPIAELDINRGEDWEFQENVFIAEHVAVTRDAELSDWVSLMISQRSVAGNTRVEATVKLGDTCQGIGFLLSAPEAAEREHLNDGYCLWLGSDLNKSTKLLRSTVEVLHAPDICLERGTEYVVRVEKVDNNIYFYLNNALQFSYVSHLPLMGTHVGLIARDGNFELSPILVLGGSQNITINCLAVPDAFLAHKDYDTALSEYRRIGYSFPGRTEGRDALFRAGITLMEQAKNQKNEKIFEQALDEFEKLHKTPGAPLEYLGKALVYKALKEYEEEIKCFELAFRRYPNHPLLPVLQEQTIHRMHESSRYHRKATYHFILLAIQHLPKSMTSTHTKRLYKHVQKHWEPLFFIDPTPGDNISLKLRNLHFATQLAFWLAKPYVLEELLDELVRIDPLPVEAIGNALFCLIELGAWELADNKREDIEKSSASKELEVELEWIKKAIRFHQKLPSSLPEGKLQRRQERLFQHMMEVALDQKNFELVRTIWKALEKCVCSAEFRLQADCYKIWALLWEKKWEEAGVQLHRYPLELLNTDTTLLHFLYGCWLVVAEGKEIADIHFSGTLPVSFPRTWSLFSHYDDALLKKTFLFEKRHLYRQLALYHAVRGEESSFLESANEAWVSVD